MMRFRTNTLIALSLSLISALVRAETPSAFAIIAAAHNAHETLTMPDIAQIFLRKREYWSDGTRIHPVNLPPNHPLREAFSQTILGGTPEQFETYWREMYFHGTLPPHVVASEDAMVLFVQSVPGAIGYVAKCIPARAIEVVLMVGEVPRCPQ